MENIVRINAYVAGREYLTDYMKVRDELFDEPAPALTLIIVSGFARKSSPSRSVIATAEA